MLDFTQIKKSEIYEYITNHGQGPNAYPTEGLITTEALPNGKTKLTYSRVLTQAELDEYDIKPEWGQ